MKRYAKIVYGLVLILVMCFALPSFISAAEAIPEVQGSAAVNGGLEAEILTDEEENNAVPVTVKIINTNTYEVTGIDYKLTSGENGRLSGKTYDSNFAIAGGSSMTSTASLNAVSGGSSPKTGDNSHLLFWLILGAASLAVLLFIAVKKKKIRQSVSMLLAIVMLAGTFATVGLPVSAVAAENTEAPISFTVTKDVSVSGEIVRLTLEVTLPDSAGDSNHTVSFLDSDSKLVKSLSIPDGGSVPVDEIPILTKTGKSFNGWSLTADEETPFYSDDPIEKDITLYPAYSELITEEYYTPVCFDAGYVEQAHRVIILSEREITSATLKDYAELETRFGDKPEITVTALGGNKYELSGVYSSKGTYCWKLSDDTVTFDALDAGVREYSFKIFGKETESYERSDELRDISAHDLISFEESEDEYVSFLNVFGSAYSVGNRLGVPDSSGGKTYYKVTKILGSEADPVSEKTIWRLQVTPCAIEEVYDEIDVNQQNREADEIIDLSNPQDVENYIRQIEGSEEMRVYADYIASAVSDSKEFQTLVQESYGRSAFIGYQSNTLLAANTGNSSTENAGNAIDEALELVGGMDIGRPGVNIKISASAPTVKLNDFNSYWDDRYAQVGEIDPETKLRVNEGRTQFFGNNFASIGTDVTVTFSLNGGNKNITVEAKLKLKQYVKICSATQVKLEVGWEIYKGSEIHAGATAYTETSVDFTVTLKTDNGGFDISEEIDDIVSAAKGEKYESDNRYIQRFRSLYDGSENDFVEVYRKDFCKFKFAVGPVEINIPVAFVVRFGLSAGVGIGYDYRTTYTVGVYKEKDSKTITPYYSAGEPGWEFNFYIAGHAGVKMGLNARLGVSIACCSKLFEIGLEAELGLRADFYGYYLLRHVKEWTKSSVFADTAGAYYFNTKIYFNLKLFASAFTFEKKWDLYSWEQNIYTSGSRYVLLDFNKRHEEQTESIIIPVTDDSKLTSVTDSGVTFKTVAFNLDSYFNSLEPIIFDLQKSNEVFNKSEAAELINKYTTVTVGGCLTLPNGRLSVTGNTSVHLRPSVLNALLNEDIQEINTSLTFVYNGPMFTFGDDRPSVTYKVKLVSEKYLTGKKYNVRYMVDGKLYQTKQYLEGTAIPPWDGYVTTEFCKSIGIHFASFDIPIDAVAADMELNATCRYAPNNEVRFIESTLTDEGIRDRNMVYVLAKERKGFPVENVSHSSGVMAAYFIGWDLEGDDSDELNVPVPGQNSTYTYHAAYGELPEYTVTIVDGATDEILSETKVRLGEAYTVESPVLPNDGRAYTSVLNCERGSYSCKNYVLGAASKIYPSSNVTLVWKHSLKVHTVDFYTDYNGTLLETQRVVDGSLITDPVGKENWSQLNYHTENGGYYEFVGWEVWNGSEFVDASALPITESCNIYPIHKYLGIKHNITLLDEDGKALLYSGLLDDGRPLNDGYYATKLSDTEKTYELCWKSADDGSVAVNAVKSGTYILCWTETARKYTISPDAETAQLIGNTVTFDAGIPYGELHDHITAKLGSFVPEKPETDFETYIYDGFELHCDANSNSEYGVCTLSFKFVSVPKKCAVTYNVKDSTGKTGTLWLGQKQITLQNGAYSFDFTLSEANSGLQLNYEVKPDDRNYNFVGWSYGGRTYSAGDTLSLVGLDSALLIAVYERKPYTVTFDTDGGVIEGELTVYANAGEHIELPTIAKLPDAQYTYRFISWDDGSGNFTESYQVNGSVTLTAVYEKMLRSYYVTFNANGGEFADGAKTVSVLTDYGAVPVPETPVKADAATERYSFDGWTPAINTVTGAAEYTAKWKVTKLYTLTFNAGSGRFSADGASKKTFVVEEGTIFNTATVPVPYYNYSGEVRRFIGWSPANESIAVTANAEFTAVWSDPVSATGICISDGAHTEDIAAFLASAQAVSGYSFAYNPGEEGVDPFFVLKITKDGLTLSGNGTVDHTEVYGVEVTLDGLTAAGNITAYGDCTFTIDKTVTITSAAETAVTLAELPESAAQAPEGSLSFTGADSSAKLVVNSSALAGGIRSFNGDISITGLTAEITAAEFVDPDTNTVHIPVALGSNDIGFNVRISDSTVRIHKGYLAGKIAIINSRVEFDDNSYNGIFSPIFNYSDNPEQPESIISLENSVMLFRGKAYMDISYAQPRSNPEVYFWFFKKEGEDGDNNPVIGWFATEQELRNALNTLAGAWMLHIGEGSSIQIGN